MTNLFIVESKNDKIFIEALIEQLNYDIEVDSPICIDDYECLEGLSESKIVTALKSLQVDIQKKDIQKVGIVIDIDDFLEDERLQWVEKCVKRVFSSDSSLLKTGDFIDICTASGEKVKLSCYFTNVDGEGELETVLKIIKSKDSTFGDCLKSWEECCQSKSKSITKKEFDKFWVSMYLRFDTCSKSDRKQAERKCSMKSFDYIMEHKKDIWDLNHPVLDKMKEFLKIFVN